MDRPAGDNEADPKESNPAIPGPTPGQLPCLEQSLSSAWPSPVSSCLLIPGWSVSGCGGCSHPALACFSESTFSEVRWSRLFQPLPFSLKQLFQTFHPRKLRMLPIPTPWHPQGCSAPALGPLGHLFSKSLRTAPQPPGLTSSYTVALTCPRPCQQDHPPGLAPGPPAQPWSRRQGTASPDISDYAEGH